LFTQRSGCIYDRYSSASSDTGFSCDRASTKLQPHFSPQNVFSGCPSSRSTSSSSIFDSTQTEVDMKGIESISKKTDELPLPELSHSQINTCNRQSTFASAQTNTDDLSCETESELFAVDVDPTKCNTEALKHGQNENMPPFSTPTQLDERNRTDSQQRSESSSTAADHSAASLTSNAVPRSCHQSCRKSSAKYRVSTRCVLVNYFSGTTSDEVDMHFNRALSHDCHSHSDKSSEFQFSFLISVKQC